MKVANFVAYTVFLTIVEYLPEIFGKRKARLS